MVRTYSELIKLPTFEERLRYLQLGGIPTEERWGSLRLLNQRFYTSILWKQARDKILIRDDGLDLGTPGYPLFDRVVIHHINPILPEQLYNLDPMVLDPENMITTCHATHNLIHYGTEVPEPHVPRRPNDTCPWR